MLASYLKQSTTAVIKVYRRLNNRQCVYCLTENPANICQSCQDALPRLGLHCPVCAEPNQHGLTCGACLSQPPAFQGVISPYQLQGPVAALIQASKHSSKVIGLDCLIRSLMHELADKQYDAIIPLPYHWLKTLKRGHSPTGLIANKLSRGLNIPYINALKRQKPTTSQQGLDKSQRKANVKRAFMLKPAFLARIQGKNLLLIDDVLTTGASCDAAASILKRHGAKSVTVACLARTPLK